MGPADLELSQAGHELGSILVTLLKDNLLIVSNQNITYMSLLQISSTST